MYLHRFYLIASYYKILKFHLIAFRNNSFLFLTLLIFTSFIDRTSILHSILQDNFCVFCVFNVSTTFFNDLLAQRIIIYGYQSRIQNPSLLIPRTRPVSLLDPA